MTSHLTLPYNWVDCVEPETCEEYVHLQDTAENLNNYPREWVEKLIPAECFSYKKAITFYDQDGEKHSREGAAREHINGTLEWLWMGQQSSMLTEEKHGTTKVYPHRENGPAIIKSDGTQEWWIDGQSHRVDGPAIIRSNGGVCMENFIVRTGQQSSNMTEPENGGVMAYCNQNQKPWLQL